MAIEGPFPFWPNPTTYPGLSQAGRSNYPNRGYSSFHNPTYAQQRNEKHNPYHQPYGSAPQHMGNLRLTSFAPGIPRVVTPPQAVPPTTPSVDPVMSALAQMMSTLNEVSDRVEGAKAQCSDASTKKRKGKRVEFIDQLPSQLGKGKERSHVSQPDRIETVSPTKWAGPVSVPFRSSPKNYSVLDRIIF